MTDETDQFVLTMTGPRTLRTAAETRAVLLAALRDHPGLILDCAEVSEADLSFVQLLLAARLSAAEAGGRLVLAAEPQGALRAVLSRGGLIQEDGRSAIDPITWGGGA